jgi:hypothetical protein
LIGLGNRNATPLRYLRSDGNWLNSSATSIGASGTGAMTQNGIWDLVYDIPAGTVACRLNEGAWSINSSVTLSGSVIPFAICNPATDLYRITVMPAPASCIDVNGKTYFYLGE